MDVTICVVDPSNITASSSRFNGISSAVLNLMSTINDIRIGFVVCRSLDRIWRANFDDIQNVEQFRNWCSSVSSIGTNTASYGAVGKLNHAKLLLIAYIVSLISSRGTIL